MNIEVMAKTFRATRRGPRWRTVTFVALPVASSTELGPFKRAWESPCVREIQELKNKTLKVRLDLPEGAVLKTVRRDNGPRFFTRYDLVSGDGLRALRLEAATEADKSEAGERPGHTAAAPRPRTPKPRAPASVPAAPVEISLTPG